MKTVHAPRNARTTEPQWKAATPTAPTLTPTAAATGAAPKRFRELNAGDVDDCLAAQDQAEVVQKAIHDALLHVAVSVHRIRMLAEPLAQMTGRHAADYQLDAAEREAMSTAGRLTEMLIDVTCEQANAADALAKIWAAEDER